MSSLAAADARKSQVSTSFGGWGTSAAGALISVADLDACLAAMKSVMQGVPRGTIAGAAPSTSSSTATPTLNESSEQTLKKNSFLLQKVLVDPEVAQRFSDASGLSLLTFALLQLKSSVNSGLHVAVNALRAYITHEFALDSVVASSQTQIALWHVLKSNVPVKSGDTTDAEAEARRSDINTTLKAILSVLAYIVSHTQNGFSYVFSLHQQNTGTFFPLLVKCLDVKYTSTEVQIAAMKLINSLLNSAKDAKQFNAILEELNKVNEASVSSFADSLKDMAKETSPALKEELSLLDSSRTTGFRLPDMSAAHRKEIAELKSRVIDISALATEARGQVAKLEGELKNFRRREPLVQLLWAEIQQLRGALNVAISAGFAYDLSDPESRYVRPTNFAYIDRLDVTRYQTSTNKLLHHQADDGSHPHGSPLLNRDDSSQEHSHVASTTQVSATSASSSSTKKPVSGMRSGDDSQSLQEAYSGFSQQDYGKVNYDIRSVQQEGQVAYAGPSVQPLTEKERKELEKKEEKERKEREKEEKKKKKEAEKKGDKSATSSAADSENTSAAPSTRTSVVTTTGSAEKVTTPPISVPGSPVTSTPGTPALSPTSQPTAAPADAAPDAPLAPAFLTSAPDAPGAPSAPGAPGAPSAPGWGPPLKQKVGPQPTKPVVKPLRKMKAFHWNRILLPVGTVENMWTTVTEKLPVLEEKVPIEELDILFADVKSAKEAADAAAGVVASPKKAPGTGAKTNQRFLSDKRFNAIAIMLSFLPSIDKVILGLRTLDSSILDKDQVLALYKQLSGSEEEVNTILSSGCDISELAGPEAFLAKMSAAIPCVSARVDCWHFSNTFREQAEDLRTPFVVVGSAIDAIRQSKCLPILCSLVLYTGNYINGSTPRGQADGFDLSVLSRLHMVKDSTGGSMLSYVVNKVLDMEGEDFGQTFVQELQPCRGASEFPLRPALSAVTRFQGVIKTQKNLFTLVQAGTEDSLDPFNTYFDNFSRQSENEGNELKKLGQQVNDSFNQLLLYLNPSMDAVATTKVQSEELFLALHEFGQNVKQAVDARKDEAKKAIQQKKQADIQARAAAAKAALAATKAGATTTTATATTATATPASPTVSSTPTPAATAAAVGSESTGAPRRMTVAEPAAASPSSSPATAVAAPKEDVVLAPAALTADTTPTPAAAAPVVASPAQEAPRGSDASDAPPAPADEAPTAASSSSTAAVAEPEPAAKVVVDDKPAASSSSAAVTETPAAATTEPVAVVVTPAARVSTSEAPTAAPVLTSQTSSSSAAASSATSSTTTASSTTAAPSTTTTDSTTTSTPTFTALQVEDYPAPSPSTPVTSVLSEEDDAFMIAGRGRNDAATGR